MARAAVLGRLTWRVGTVTGLREETSSARTLVLDVPGWPGHDAGQHVDVRLTAPDGYSATRAYSIASAPAGERIELTVGVVPDGEVSPYLTGEVAVGDELELRGPLGGWFVWRPGDPAPVQLVAGGTGLVPLMAMVRTRALAGDRTPMRLLYSVRDPASALYHDELDALRHHGDLDVTVTYTRLAPPGDGRRPARVGADLVRQVTINPQERPTCYVCGPTPFVEAVADLLVAAGHDPARIRAERFGPTGG